MGSGRYWKKPARKDIGDVLLVFHQAGWRIMNPPTYYSVRCPCGKRQRQIHLTPSNPNYCETVLRWLYRQDCYRRESSDE